MFNLEYERKEININNNKEIYAHSQVKTRSLKRLAVACSQFDPSWCKFSNGKSQLKNVPNAQTYEQSGLIAS